MTDVLLLTFLFLVAGVVAVPVAARLGLGSVLGYLIAGIALSPALALLDVDVVQIQHVAEFGVVMMLFLVGLELEPRRLWEMRARVLGLGGLQVAGSAAAVMAAAMLLGLPWTHALATGLVLSLSSTAIVLQTLTEKGLLRSDGGQASFSVLLFQDIAVIPMLALLPLLAMPELVDAAAHGAEDPGPGPSLVEGLPGWGRALVTLGAVGAVIGGGMYLTGPIFRFVAGARLRELFTATALMIVVAIALVMSLVGLSAALGTFVAGVVLATSEYRHELESDIDPFRGLLLGLFFITIGAGIDFDLLRAGWLPVLGLTLGLIAVKAAVLLVLGRMFGVAGADRWLFSLGLAQAGEFGFVLLSFVVANAILPQGLADTLLLVVALSMLLTPALFILYDRAIAPRFAAAEPAADEIDAEGEILILGHGRFGGIVNRVLRGAGYETVVVDYSSSQLQMLRTFGFRVYFGDATRPDLLQAAGIARARLVVVAIDDKAQITQVVRHIVRHHPGTHVLARARDREHVYTLYAAGCRDIIRETYDSSLRAARSALEAVGLGRAAAAEAVRTFDEMDRAALVELAKLHREDVPAHENEPYVARVREMIHDWELQLRGRAADGAETREDLARSAVTDQGG